MREYFTEAIVLGSRPRGQHDKLIDLYTKELGKVGVRVVSGRKVLSKLSPHLNVGSRVFLRLIYKNQFTVVDVLTQESFASSGGDLNFRLRVLKVIFLIRFLAPSLVPDAHLWHRLLASLRECEVDCRMFLKVFGYDPLLARCGLCGDGEVSSFFVRDQIFGCGRCSRKLPEADLVYL